MRRHLTFATAALAATSASLCLLAGGALADGPAPVTSAAPTAATTTATNKPTKPKPKRPAPKPTAATARLYLYDAFLVGHHTVDVPGRAMHVTGVVRPYVSGQTVTLRAHLGRKLVSRRHLRVRPSRSGRAGHFVAAVTAPRSGTLHLQVSHRRSPRMLGFSASRSVDSVAEVTSSPLFASLVQQRLAARHLYLPRSGHWDLQTELAIGAYHRLLGRGTSTTLDGPTLTALLNGRGAFRVRDPRDGTHAEGDLGNQLLALVKGSAVQAIYPISSGKPSTPTILGRYRVYLRDPGYLPDGMYYSDFFIRGYAIHGYDPAPDYPASHGCMRLPISDAISVYDWLSIGDVVDVYQ